MKEKLSMEEWAAQIASQLKEEYPTFRERSQKARDLFDQLCLNLAPDDQESNHLQAPNAVVEIIDRESGLLCRRYLEIEYDETGNGLRLCGDDIAGNPAQIVFLSSTALESMKDLQGRGPDAPRCKH